MVAGDWHSDVDFNCLLGSSWYEPKLVDSKLDEGRIVPNHYSCVDRYETLRVKYVECLRACANLTNEVKRLEEENYNLRLDRHALTETEREWS